MQRPDLSVIWNITEVKKARRLRDEKCGFAPFVRFEKYIALYSLAYCHAKRRGGREKNKWSAAEAWRRPTWHASARSLCFVFPFFDGGGNIFSTTMKLNWFQQQATEQHVISGNISSRGASTWPPSGFSEMLSSCSTRCLLTFTDSFRTGWLRLK